MSVKVVGREMSPVVESEDRGGIEAMNPWRVFS